MKSVLWSTLLASLAVALGSGHFASAQSTGGSTAGASAASAPTGKSSVAPAKTKLTVVSWGGAYALSQERAYIDPYRKLNPDIDVELLDDGGEAVAALRAQVAIGAPTWDVVDVTAADAIRLCQEGIAMKIDHDKMLSLTSSGIPPSKDFGQTIVSPCFIPQIVYSTTLGYRSDKFSAPPAEMCSLFDLEKFPGKRALEKRPINNLEWALLCDGVAPEDLYVTLEEPGGLARALAKLGTIRDQVVWWSKGEEPVELLRSGEVIMASAYNGRLFNAIEVDKAPIAMLWDRQVFDFDGWIIPEGSLNRDEALRFVRFATETHRLADQAKYISYGPARKSSALIVGKHAELGIDMKPHMPTTPENARTALIYNYVWWAQNRDRIDAEFANWLNK